VPTTSTSSRRIGAPDSKTREPLWTRLSSCCSRRATPPSRHGASLRRRLEATVVTTTSARWTTSSSRSIAPCDESLARFERAIRPTAHCAPCGLHADPRVLRSALNSSRSRTTAKAIRAEIAGYAERFRAAQLEALTAALVADGLGADQLPPVVALVLMTGCTGARARKGARYDRVTRPRSSTWRFDRSARTAACDSER